MSNEHPSFQPPCDVKGCPNLATIRYPYPQMPDGWLSLCDDDNEKFVASAEEDPRTKLSVLMIYEGDESP